jgi:ribonuclease HI
MIATIIYTDGSCVGPANCRVAGYGVCWQTTTTTTTTTTWCDHLFQLEPHQGPQTNQRAELLALYCALFMCDAAASLATLPEIVIRSDSKYSINCLVEWIHSWRRNGWLTSKKMPVMNRDLIEPAAELYERNRLRVRLEWVKGHSVSEGNNRADSLATRAASMSPPQQPPQQSLQQLWVFSLTKGASLRLAA